MQIFPAGILQFPVLIVFMVKTLLFWVFWEKLCFPPLCYLAKSCTNIVLQPYVIEHYLNEIYLMQRVGLLRLESTNHFL